MRKRIVQPERVLAPLATAVWLHLDQLAMVEISSEEATHPIDLALLPSHGDGWRAAVPGIQLLRLLFDTPQRLRLIRIRIIETQIARTQELVLRYSRDNDNSQYEIVRQQWNFSPNGSISELEEYQVDLTEVTTLELIMIPDVSGGNAYASLAEFRLA